jgi:hypothetical protein
MSLVFQQAGLDVGHELMGVDGVVDYSLGPRARPNEFVVLHQVRQPIKVIANFTLVQPPTWRRIAQYYDLIREPVLHRCMQYWLEWNKLVEKKARWTYRIEDIDRVWPKICDEIGIPHCPEALEGIPRNQHTKAGKYEPRKWAELESVDSDMTKKIRDLAARYGYTKEYLTD